ncbi:MAG TPA: hypothetical protein VFB80_19675 [Pirellulaceae bacterium]|nr:hypothetical protein [Pirellulaceae bacterium]
MKRVRVLGLLLAVAAILAVPVSHLVWGAPPPGNKQLICHIDEDGTGKVLEISVHAIPAHCAHHAGDYTSPPMGSPALVKGAACPRLAANAVRVCR